MANLERTYIIPVRREIIKVPKYKRAKKAVNTVRSFLSKHMKSDDVKLGNMINREMWKNGIKNPPGKIRITAMKDEKGVVKAELFGHKYVEKKKVEKKEKSKLEELKEKMLGKEEEKKEEHIKEEVMKHPPEHEHRDHTTHEKPAQLEKKQDAAMEKDRKSTVDKTKAGIRDKR